MPIPTSHCMNRKFEWISSGILIQIGLATVFAPLAGITVSSAEMISKHLGVDQHAIAFFFLFVAAMSCVALYANGQWHISPLVRASGCALRMMIYGELSLSVIEVMLTTKVLYFALFAWLTLTVLDARYFLRALDDYGEKRRQRLQLIRASKHAAGVS